MLVFLIITLFISLIIGVPIFISLILPTEFTLFTFTSMEPYLIDQRMFARLDQCALMAMPLFIFAAHIMLRGGIADRLLKWAGSLMSWLTGGTAFTTHFACMFFGALSGSSPATVAAIGGVMYPELRRNKYKEGFSVGLISSSAAVAILIPPSVTMILYGVATGVSIGSLFIAGIGAGIVYTLSIAVYIFYWTRKNDIGKGKPFNFSDFIESTKSAVWTFGVPLIILGGIYLGIFTPTESAGISTVYAIFISMFIYKEMDFKKLYKVSVEAAIITAQVMVLTAAAVVFGWLLTVGQVPQMLTQLVTDYGTSTIVFLILLNIVFLIAGMFMDGSGAIMLLAPIVFPLGMAMNIDPVHLGVIITTNLAIGMYTPPLGLNMFIAHGVTKVPIDKIIVSSVPFLVFGLIALVIITYVPSVSLFLPSLVYP